MSRPVHSAVSLASVAAVLFAVAAVFELAGARAGAFQAGTIIDVPAGGNLQAALNQVQPGGTIRLAPGAIYVGSYTLPAKNGTDWILITTRDAALPPAGQRITPNYKSRLATIRSASSSALRTAAGASYYRIRGVAFESNQNGSGDLITIGHADYTALSQLPQYIEIDQVLLTGHATAGQKRGIAANGMHVSITNSDIRDIKGVGQDTQAIAAWNTNGPITIRNNYLEAAGENILFGGAQVNIPGAVPSDILVEDNFMTKNTAWIGTSWTVKNLFELKNARRVVIRRNVMQFNWAGGQPGYAVVFTPRNSSGTNPWIVIEDVEFSGNVLSHTGSAFNLLGHDDSDISGQLARIVIRNNLVFDVGGQWDGAGVFAQLGGEPRDITIDHNTILHDGNVVTFYRGQYPNSSGVMVNGGPVLGFVFSNNLLKHNDYGIFGSGQAYGNGTLAYYAPGAVVQRNVFASNSSIASRYPADNLFPSVTAFMGGFQNAGSFDYRLLPTSPYLRAGTDGRDIGCDLIVQQLVSRPKQPKGLRVNQQ
jgi:hypothetical protein